MTAGPGNGYQVSPAAQRMGDGYLMSRSIEHNMRSNAITPWSALIKVTHAA
jgi:hypothetical protein